MAKTHGKTTSGKPITDDLIDELAKKAEAGYDPESVRLEPGLRDAFVRRPKKDHEATSAVSTAKGHEDR